MKIVIALALLTFFNLAHAEIIHVELHDVAKDKTHTYFINLDSLEVIEEMLLRESVSDERTGRYTISNEALTYSGEMLLDADELLFEAKLEGLDMILIRDEYNSYSNPLKWLSAVSGHPVQASRIYILKVVSGKVVDKLRLIQQDSSYKWKVEVHYAN